MRLLIVLSVEDAPRVVVDCLSDGEEGRLLDWLEQRPGYLELVRCAQELAAEERVA